LFDGFPRRLARQVQLVHFKAEGLGQLAVVRHQRFGAVGSAGRRDAIQAAWTNIWKAGGTVDIVKSLHQVNGRYFTIPWHGKTKNYHPFVVADRDYREIADKAGISISCSALANAYSALAGIEDCPLQCPKSLDDTPFE